MAIQHSLQASRFELKYIVDERCAAGVRDFVRSYLEPDEFADPDNGNSYRISSLYLDNSELFLYRQTLVGEKNRFKLRIRFYDDNPNGPAFLEIKRRVTDVILKEREKVTREGVLHLLSGKSPDPSWVMAKTGDPSAGKALLNFRNLSDDLQAAGAIYVSYQREAYVSPNSNSIRVTFDRQLLGSPYEQGSMLSLPSEGARPRIGNGDNVILELKFTDRFPMWMRELALAFNLNRTSVPKYVHCIDTMGITPGHLFGPEMAVGREW
ncbi:MAG TPA: polyphosphate polymerase domain-containing protein [Thermoguttaceae bacterium]|nr:polyphosphate polymerase domain-containing protein [Thermoguttaceae bacterium]